jgi:RNA polymerase sigma-70 factor (ECF subfamily)
MDEHTLNAPLQAARAGDALAVNDLLRHLRPYVFRRLHDWSPQAGDQSDVAQQVLLKISQQLGECRADTVPKFLAWVKRVAYTTMLDSRRRYQPGRLDESVAGQVADDATSPSMNVVRAEQREQQAAEVAKLHAAIAQLEPRKRQVLELRYLQGLPFAEVAERVGMSEDAAKLLCWRTCQKLKLQLEPAPSA